MKNFLFLTNPTLQKKKKKKKKTGWKPDSASFKCQNIRNMIFQIMNYTMIVSLITVKSFRELKYFHKKNKNKILLGLDVEKYVLRK